MREFYEPLESLSICRSGAMAKHICIAKANDLPAVSFQLLLPPLVTLVDVFVVLAIELHNRAFFDASEVNKERFERMLTSKF